MNLYEINREILGCIDEETGEILDAERLDQLQISKAEKLESIALWVLELTAQAAEAAAEIKRLRELREKKLKRVESLKAYLQDSLEAPFSTGKVDVRFRRSASVCIDNFDDIPTDLKRQTVEYTPDKVKIGELLKAGINVPGAHIENKRNVVIK